jgi:hypothetical protein
MSVGWSAADILRIVAAGGAIDTSARRLTANDGSRIADAARRYGTHATFRETAVWSASDAARIAAAGKGHVTFAD